MRKLSQMSGAQIQTLLCEDDGHFDLDFKEERHAPHLVEQELNSTNVTEEFRENPFEIQRGYQHQQIRPKEERVIPTGYLKKEIQRAIVRVTDDLHVPSKYEKSSVMLVQSGYLDIEDRNQLNRKKIYVQFLSDIEDMRARRKKKEQEKGRNTLDTKDYGDGTRQLLQLLATRIINTQFPSFHLSPSSYQESHQHLEALVKNIKDQPKQLPKNLLGQSMQSQSNI